ncbi:uncharacterized protein LOC128951258 [Oppia nitens]|uniref:uncharacterized protein LOC128951258 n=1 Tax=Oppia nitens TaxID=1686743 RepID=UPI0023DB532E|nr:uncharacterized protein LOC128951258 [Oppia nitens]
MSIKLILVINLLYIVCHVLCVQLTCNKSSERTADTMFGHMVGYGNNSRRFPENDDEMQKYCSAQLADLKVLENYTKRCKKGLPKQFFAIMMYTLKSNVNRMCKRNSKKGMEFMVGSKCFNKATFELEKCHNVFIDHLQGVLTVDDKLKIPHTCCEYYSFRQCLTERAKNVDICGDKDLQTLDEFVESTTSNALNFFCGDYADDSDKCDKLGKPPKKRSNLKRTKSISITIAEIFQSFPEQ